MAHHQTPNFSEIKDFQDQANDVLFKANEHDLARHTLAWCELEEGLVPTQLLNHLLKTTRTSCGIPPKANLGWMLSQCQRSNEAVNRLYRDLDKHSDSEELQLFAAISLQRTRDFRTSEMVLKQILKSSPQNQIARGYLGKALMNLGKWSEGFVELEKSRGELTPLQQEFCQDISRLWLGQDIRDKHIVIVGNDNLSDQIQFSRFAQSLETLGPHKIGFACSPELVNPMRSIPGINRVDSKRFEPYDYFIPVESLPFRLGATPSNIPAQPYLRPNVGKVEQTRNFLRRTRPLLGICWRNRPFGDSDEPSFTYETRANSLDLHQVKEILKELHPNYDIISLQTGLNQDEKELLGQYGVRELEDPNFSDYQRAAEIVSSLDHIITVDSPIAHLVGALGIEADILLPYVPDWKWTIDGNQSKWYPHLQIHHKKTESSWGDCLNEVISKFATTESLSEAV